MSLDFREEALTPLRCLSMRPFPLPSWSTGSWRSGSSTADWAVCH
jgi:hypothetical protein